MNFVLYGWAIAWTPAFNGPRIHGRAVHRGANDVVRSAVSVGDIAGNLRLSDAGAGKGKRQRLRVPMLYSQFVEIYGARIETWAGTGFQPADFKAEIHQRFTKTITRAGTGASCRIVAITNMNQPF